MSQTSEQKDEKDDPYEYLRIELEVRRCKKVTDFIEWWDSEPAKTHRRQALGKHGSKMADSKTSQKCSQLFRGENKTFTPWKRELEILFQTVTVLSVNLGRRVSLLGHEHAFVQYVVKPEYVADFEELTLSIQKEFTLSRNMRDVCKTESILGRIFSG